ncbi:MAG: DUF1150 family protein [Alphaproteobacteria bacterium]
MHVEQPLRLLSQADFLRLGTDDVAYIKPIVSKDGTRAYAIHAADGSALAVAASYLLAEATIKQNNLEPLAAH